MDETITFNLSDKNVYMHDYTNTGIEEYEPEARAKSRIGEQKFNMFTNRSNHLTKWCKIKQNQQVQKKKKITKEAYIIIHYT